MEKKKKPEYGYVVAKGLFLCCRMKYVDVQELLEDGTVECVECVALPEAKDMDDVDDAVRKAMRGYAADKEKMNVLRPEDNNLKFSVEQSYEFYPYMVNEWGFKVIVGKGVARRDGSIRYERKVHLPKNVNKAIMSRRLAKLQNDIDETTPRKLREFADEWERMCANG